MYLLKPSILLSAITITLLISSSNTTLARVSDTWLKAAQQPTESQKAADKAKEERMAELKKAMEEKNKAEGASEPKASAEPMKPAEEPGKKAEEVKKAEMPQPPAPPKAGPAHKPRTLQEQIALGKEKEKERILRIQDESKAKHAANKPLTWKERALQARQQREARTHLGQIEKQEMQAKSEMKKEEPKTIEHKPVELKTPLKMEQHPDVVTTEHKPVELKTPLKVEHHPDVVTTEHKPVELKTPLKMEQHPDVVTTEPAEKPMHMSPSQKKLMDELEAKEKAKASSAPMAEANKPAEPSTASEEKPVHMSPTQKHVMEAQEAQDKAATGASNIPTPPKMSAPPKGPAKTLGKANPNEGKPALSFLDELKKKRPEIPAAAGD